MLFGRLKYLETSKKHPFETPDSYFFDVGVFVLWSYRVFVDMSAGPLIDRMSKRVAISNTGKDNRKETRKAAISRQFMEEDIR